MIRDKMNNRSNAIIFLINLFSQIFIYKRWLDNQVINQYSPSSAGAFEYVEIAKEIVKGDFKNGLKEGWRMPGYPIFLSVIFILSDKPICVARYIQIVLSSILVIISFLNIEKNNA